MFILLQNKDEILKGDFFDRYAIVKTDEGYCIQGHKYESNSGLLLPQRTLAKYPTIEAAEAVLLGMFDALLREQNIMLPDYQ